MDDKIVQLNHVIETNPYIEVNHDNKINYITLYCDELKLNELHNSYCTKLKYFRLKLNDFNQWLNSIQKWANEGDRDRYKLEVYKLMELDYYNSTVVKVYLDLSKSTCGENTDIYISMVSKFIKTLAHDYMNSKEIWDILLKQLREKYDMNTNEANSKVLKNVHLKRLSFPNNYLDEFFSEYSALISEIDPKNYDNELKNANKVYQNSKKASFYYENFELQIDGDMKNPHIWIDYMQSVYKFSKTKDVNEILPIFERAIANDQAWTEEWETVWLSMLYLIYSAEKIDQKLLDFVLNKYVRTFPQSCCAYAETILNVKDADSYSEIKDRMAKIDLRQSSSYLKWKLVSLAMIQVENRYKSEDTVEKFIDHLQEYAEFALKNDDPSHSVEKLAISILTEMGFQETALELVYRMLDSFNTQADVWIYGMQYLIQTDTDPDTVRSLFQKSLANASNLDYPEKLTEEFLLYEQLHGDIDSYRKATVKCNYAMIEAIKNRSQQDVIVVKNDAPSIDNRKKRENEEEDSRSRENNTVVVNNLPSSVTQAELEIFFKDCGIINCISIKNQEHSTKAIIEFSNENEVFAALTKTHKLLHGSEIEVTKLEESIIFINNYPSTFNQQDIKEIFEEFGPVLDVRFPRQSKNRVKRFCYLQFESTQDAQRAIANYHGKEYTDELSRRKFKWDVKLSRPKDKKQREDDLDVRVVNLNYSANDQDLTQVFKSCGEIQNISFPKQEIQKGKFKNGGLAIITFKTAISAEKALEKDHFEVKGRKIHVTKPFKKAFQPEDFNESKTIGLINLDPTINKYQVQKHLDENYGKTEKTLMLPLEHCALVEFSALSDAGKIILSNPEIELENSKVKVVTKGDILKRLTKPTNPISLIPNAVKRRKV